MPKKTKSPNRMSGSTRSEPTSATSNSKLHVNPGILPLHERAVALIQSQQIPEAMTALRGQAHSDPWLRNLLGVCLLRSDRPQDAMDVLRPNAWQPNGVMLRTDVPAEFLVNFVTALLIQGRVNAALNTLNAINQESHPAVARLRAAIDRWLGGLSFWSRWKLRLGIDPADAVALDFLPGELPSIASFCEPA